MKRGQSFDDFIESFRPWLISMIAGSLFVLSQFYRASVAVISPDLIREMGFGAWELSTVSASFFYAFALMQIPVGIFLDSIGPRITMTGLTLIAIAGALIFSMGQSYHALTAGRILLGIGMACNFMGTLKLIANWFGPGQFATLSAVIVSAGTLGNIVAATPLALMVRTLGWRNSFVTMSGLTFVVVALFFFFVKDQPRAGTVSDHQNSPRPRVSDTLKRARILFAQRDFWIISVATFCRYGIYAAVQALWVGPYLIQVAGLSPVTAGNIILLMSIGMVIGSPFSGHLSDTVFMSRKKIIVFGMLGMIMTLGILAIIPDGTGMAVLSILFFCFGVFSSTGQIMYAHIKEQVPNENAGLAMTAINFFTMAGVAVFLQGLGFLMKYLYPGTSLGISAFRSAFVFCGICLAVVCACYTLTKETLPLKKDNIR